MDASEQYMQNSISTQERGKLIVMLYDGAIKFLRVAKQKLREEDYARKGVYIGKAQDIVAELNNCLNVEAAPDIANDLRALYNFIHHHLNEANIERSVEKIDDCIGILDELRGAWEEAASRAEPASSAQQDQAPESVRPGGFEA